MGSLGLAREDHRHASLIHAHERGSYTEAQEAAQSAESPDRVELKGRDERFEWNPKIEGERGGGL